MNLDTLIQWLAASPLSVTIGAHDWATPLIQTVHILAIAGAMAAILITDLKMLGAVGRHESAGRFTARYMPLLGGALVVLLLSGSLLIIGEPKRSLENPVFVLKMVLLLFAVALTFAIHWPLRADEAYWTVGGQRRSAVRGMAIVSLAIWTAIVFAGRWIAYAQS